MNSLNNSNKYITRIAPSPSGMAHIGTMRTAYFNWLAAKASNGKFILRIDDTDIERNKKEYIDVILDSLDWLGLDYDAIYYQSNRTQLYISETQGLVNAGKAKELDNGAVALLLPSDMPSSFTDTIAGSVKITETNHNQIHQKVILLRGYSTDPNTGKVDKSKLGTPTYQLASTIDDYLLLGNNTKGLTPWIIRGVDHITNTPKQLAIWCALNEVYGPVKCPTGYPLFSHIGLIHKSETIEEYKCVKGHDKCTEMYPDSSCPYCEKTVKKSNKKLSKRDGAASLLQYKREGYTPEAMLNFMLRLGWSPKGDNKEHTYINKERALELFLSGNLKNSAAQYDLAKLDALQKHYKDK